jgi:hypothetical protein
MKMQANLTIDNSHQKLLNPSSVNFKIEANKLNKNWMKDWMEQADNYKKNPEVAALIENNIEGFLHYADLVENGISV